MLELQTRMVIAAAHARDCVVAFVKDRREHGATTLEYVVIAAVVFVAAVALAGIIRTAIQTRQSQITNGPD